MENSETQWLNEKFVSDILEHEEGSEVRITDLQVENAVAQGNNFCGTIYRVAVDFVDKTGGNQRAGLIVKALPKGEFIRTFVKDAGLFTRESGLYRATLPAMYALAREKAPEFALPLSPRSFLTVRPDTVVLEDLSTSGYKMADRISRLDFDHCRLALEELARFHGMSVALFARDDSLVDQYVETFYTEKCREIFTNFLVTPLKNLAAYVGRWEGYERFKDKVLAFGDTLGDKLIRAAAPQKNFLNVLNHGDFWVNNMMFQHSDAGEVDSVRLLDFQASRYTSPVLDLLYFLYTSPNDEVRSRDRDRLLALYHARLCETLTALGHADKCFTMEALQAEMLDKEFFGFTAASSVLALILLDPEQPLDMDNMTAEFAKQVEEKMMEKTYSGKEYRKTLQMILLHCEEKGVL